MDGKHEAMPPVSGNAHSVQLYESDAELLDEVGGFIGAGLDAGDAGIVIATEEHRDQLLQRLSPRRAPLPSGDGPRGCTLLDAASTLSSFMVDGQPDESRFVHVIGGAIDSASRAGNGRVRAFGEMVALLLESGNTEGALRLEQLWNDLAQRRSFSLLCSYPMRLFGSAEDGAAFRKVCEQHTHVHPHLPPEAESGDARDRYVAGLRQKALALETEIARRKEVEAQLRRRERELSDFIENAAEGLHRVGPDGTILWANRAELELLGYSPAEYVGHDIHEFHVDQPVIDGILERLQRGETLRDQPARLRHRDGGIRHVLINSNALFDKGRFVYSRCFTRDVTERVRLQNALEHKVSQLALADRRKDDFLAMLGHELRNPLAPISNAIEVMRRLQPEVSGTQLQLREIIERQVVLMTRLVDDLLDVARISRGKIQLKFGEHRLGDTLQRAAEIARPLILERGHRLDVDIADPDLRLWGDQARMAQAVANLLNNAAKYTGNGGSVRLQARAAEGEVAISVVDNGIGLSEELRATIFEPFVQADTSIGRSAGGLGVGLTLVRSIVQLHGGSVEAHSDGPGHGSRFTLCVPLCGGAAQGPLLDDSGAHPAAVAEPQRILIVDDNLEAAESLRQWLEACGHDVHVAGDGASAIALAGLMRPQITIIDLALPDIDGYALGARLRARLGEHARLIALTAYSREQDALRAHQNGFDDLATKPVNIAEFAPLLCGAGEKSP